jgi:hypothetical protein
LDFNEETGVYRRVRLGTVCGIFHHVAHIGRSRQAAAGHLDIKAAVDHFLTVNGVEMAVFAQTENEAISMRLHISTIQWTPDYGEYASLIPVVPVRLRN